MLGYFNKYFGGLYAQHVRAMLKAPKIPKEGFRLATRSPFRVYPWTDPFAHHYEAKLVEHNPLIDRDRKGYSLWTCLSQASDRAWKTYRLTCRQYPGDFEQYLYLSAPSENRGGYTLQVERICTTRPRVSNADVATLMANQWVYIGNKGEEMASAGYDPITYGLYRETGCSEEHSF